MTIYTKYYNYNKIFITISILLITICSCSGSSSSSSSSNYNNKNSILLSRRNKHIELYHPETNELIINSPINDNTYSREHIHNLINKNRNNKNNYYNNINNNNNNNNNGNNLFNNSKLQINNENSNNNNNNNKIYSFLKLKSKDYSLKDDSSSILYGGITSSFEYFIPILVGTPPQMFTVQVDTGSTSLAVPGSNCLLYKSQTIKTSCSCSDGNLDGLYNFDESNSAIAVNCSSKLCSNTCPNNGMSLYYNNKLLEADQSSGDSISGSSDSISGSSGSGSSSSSSSSNNNYTTTTGNDGVNNNIEMCPFMLKYGDGSFIAGSLVVDNVTIGQYTVAAKFGNIQKESLSFSQLSCPSNSRSQAVRDGILGLSYQELDPNNGDDIFSKIVNSYGIKNVFSMCLGKNGGILTLGGINEEINLEEPNYTPINDNHYYSISVTNVYVDEESLKLTPSDFTSSIVDSGTTLLYFNSAIFNGIITVLGNYNLIGFREGDDQFWNGNCHYLTNEDIKKYPIIYLEMLGKNGIGSFKLAITPELYFLKINNLHCFGISQMKEISVLIGDVVLQGYNVIYDRGNSQIGFAKIKNCNSAYSDNAPLQLSMLNGNNQKATEENQFLSPLTLLLTTIVNNSSGSGSGEPPLSVSEEELILYNNNSDVGIGSDGLVGDPVGGVIVGFSVVSGNAYFYPSHLSIIRNITDINGIVSIIVVPKFFGKIIIEATVWGNNNTNTVYFTLHSNMKPWKIVLISLSVFMLSLILLLIGFLVYKKKIKINFNAIKNGRNNNNNNNNEEDDDQKFHRLINQDDDDDDEYNNSNKNEEVIDIGSIQGSGSSSKNSSKIEWDIFGGSKVQNLSVNNN